MSLRRTIIDIQRAVGVEADGIFGPVTAGAVYAALSDAIYDEGVPPEVKDGELDPRTLKNIATLDEKARPAFVKFSRLAEATAAAMGCEYKMISAHRSWEEQQALYDQGRTKPGRKVTNARPGYSWHNFGIAGDYGVFRGRDYLDGSDPTLARRVHIACAAHAEECGLEWGGNWKSFQDIPHYHLAGLGSSPKSEHRKLYKKEGSVL